MPITRMYVQVCDKDVEVAPNVIKKTYYGYRKDYNAQSDNFVDITTPTVDKEGKPTFKAISFKVKLTELFLKENPSLTFPCILDVDLTQRIDEKTPFAFISRDKVIDNKGNKRIRIDRNGRQHAVLVINKVLDIIKLEPREPYSFDDIDTIELD